MAGVKGGRERGGRGGEEEEGEREDQDGEGSEQEGSMMLTPCFIVLPRREREPLRVTDPGIGRTGTRNGPLKV